MRTLDNRSERNGSFYDFHKRKGIMRYSEGKSYWYYTVPPYFDEFLNITGIRKIKNGSLPGKVYGVSGRINPPLFLATVPRLLIFPPHIPIRSTFNRS